MEYFWDSCPSIRLFHLYRRLLKLSITLAIVFLVTRLFCPVCTEFVWRVSSRKSPRGSKPLPFHNDPVLLRSVRTLENGFIPLPRSMFWQFDCRGVQSVPWTSWLGFWSGMLSGHYRQTQNQTKYSCLSDFKWVSLLVCNSLCHIVLIVPISEISWNMLLDLNCFILLSGYW